MYEDSASNQTQESPMETRWKRQTQKPITPMETSDPETHGINGYNSAD